MIFELVTSVDYTILSWCYNRGIWSWIKIMLITKKYFFVFQIEQWEIIKSRYSIPVSPSTVSILCGNENRSFIIFGHMLWFFSPKLYLRRPVFPLCALQLDGSSAKKVIKSRVSFFLLLYIALLDCILLTVVKVIKEGQ